MALIMWGNKMTTKNVKRLAALKNPKHQRDITEEIYLERKHV